MGYLGSKGGAGVWQTIVGLMPPHDTYVEAFAGSGVIAERKAPAERTILLDKDAAAVAALRALPLAGAPGVEVHQADAFAFLADLDLDQLGRLLVYADPPYLLSTRTSAKRYACEISERYHRGLATILRALAEGGAAVIVSGYPSPLYDQLFAGWETREFQTMSRGGVRTEKLWLSFTPGAVHWASYAGRDFTDRQRIKRKAARWAQRFAQLPPAEAQAVLAAILAARDPAQPSPTMAESAAAGSMVAPVYGRRRASPPPSSAENDCADPIAGGDYATLADQDGGEDG